MSTRYVWSKYRENAQRTEQKTLVSSDQVYYGADDPNIGDSVLVDSSGYGLDAPGYPLGFTPLGNKAEVRFRTTSDFELDNAYKYPYAFARRKSGAIGVDCVYANEYYPGSQDIWFAWIGKRKGYFTIQLYPNGQTITGTEKNFYKLTIGPAEQYRNEDYIGEVSSSAFNAYPNQGKSGDYYYKWRGSDNIDPSSVTYTKSELQAGEAIGISVNPRQPAYGGTFYYQFSYSIDGGKTWTNIGDKITALSVSVTIPDGAQQFQARAVASDNLGFTSTTPVYGASLGVSALKAYVGIGNKARAVSKIYIGVNGRAREVVKGYVGVNGKARKFL